MLPQCTTGIAVRIEFALQCPGALVAFTAVRFQQNPLYADGSWLSADSYAFSLLANFSRIFFTLGEMANMQYG